MTDPGHCDRIGSRTDPLDRAFRHIGGKGRDTIDPLASVSIDIDERRDVGDVILDQSRRFLRLLQRLGQNGDQRQLLDPEARLDLFRPVPKQFCQPGDIAHGFGCSRPDRLSRAVDLLDDEIGSAHAQPALLELINQLSDKAPDILVDRLGSPDRFCKGFADFNQLRRADWLNRLGNTTEHLVKAAADLRTEAKRQRRAWRVGKLADRLETEDSQVRDNLCRQAQQRYRQLLDGAHRLAGRNDDRLATDRPGAGMSRTPAIGDRHTGGELSRQELVGDFRHHGKLAALQMVGAFGIHDDAVAPIDGDDRRIDR